MRHSLLALSLFAAACASYDGRGLQPGVTSESEVRRTMGPPALELDNPDGSRTLAYPKGPLGTRTYMVKLGPDGMVGGVEQVLNEDHFYRIVPGITRDDVLRTIGPPSQVDEFPRLQQTAWEYRYQDAWGYTAILSVMIDPRGIVVGKTTRRLERGDRNNNR